MNWYIKVLKQYADFNGRARRKEYWMFVLINLLIGVACMILAGIGVALESMALASVFYLLYALYSLAVFVPCIAVTVRRLHDIGKDWVYILVVLIPLIGGIWLLVLCAQEGTPGSNQYGPNPKEIDLV